jgi:hypothetical protein
MREEPGELKCLYCGHTEYGPEYAPLYMPEVAHHKPRGVKGIKL